MIDLAAIFLITLGLAQIVSTLYAWHGISLVGVNRPGGIAVAVILLGLGASLLSGQRLAEAWPLLFWPLLTVPLALATLVVGGSLIAPPDHPDRLFEKENLHHGGCERLTIQDGDESVPALLLHPLPEKQTQAAVCLVHGAGDHKMGFKWRLVRALLAEGLTVLSIDLPGHGEYQHQPLVYPDCLTAIPAALQFLRNQPDIDRIGLLGISLGGAIALKSVVSGLSEVARIEALVIAETPLWIKVNRKLVRQEVWRTLNAPILSLFHDITLWQLRQSWHPAINTCHAINDLFGLLNPLDTIVQLNRSCPLLLVYSRHDPIAPLSFGQQLQQAAPQATILPINKSSHVTLTLMPSVNQQIARWLRQHLY